MKRPLLALLVLMCASTNIWSQVVLVTEDEMRASLAAPEPFRVRAVPAPGAPRIELKAPSLEAPVKAPVNIWLLFKTETPALAKPESFKAFYGRLRLDITQRLLAAAKVTASGIQVEGASLPKGQHRLHLRIEDSLGRLGERSFEFEIQ